MGPLRALGGCGKRGEIKGVARVSETDSFIEEVTEEVRRDKLFARFRKYGWIGGLAVVLIVGGAAFSEWRNANATAVAEQAGDAMFDALRENQTSAARIAALQKVATGAASSQTIATLLLAAEQSQAGQDAEAAKTLANVGTGENREEVALIYRQIAAFKALVVNSDGLSAADRRLQFEALAQPGAALRLLAEEQLALMAVEIGDKPAAIAQLQRIVADAEVTAGLRQRATQLIVVLGGKVAATTASGEPSVGN